MTDLTYQAESLLVPPGTLKAWQGDQAVAFRSCIAAEFDNLAITTEKVAEARSPLLCDPTVLPYHGRDRRVRRYSTESELSYRRRLAKWRQIWGSAGRAWGILRQLRIFLAAYGRPRLRIVSTDGDGSRSQWCTLDPGDGTRDYFELGGLDPEFSRHVEAPGNWNWDGDFYRWSRYWVLIYTDEMTGVSPPEDWDGGIAEWDGSATWDGYLPAAVMADIVSLCQDWDAAQSMLAGVFQVHEPGIFDPTGSGAGFPDGTWYLHKNRIEGVSYSFVKGPA